MNILTVNLLFSTFVFWVAARIYVSPKLAGLSPQTLLLPILMLHAFRHLGLMFLTPGATYAGIPPQFAYPAAVVGDALHHVRVPLEVLEGTAELRRRRIGCLCPWLFGEKSRLHPQRKSSNVLGLSHGVHNCGHAARQHRSENKLENPLKTNQLQISVRNYGRFQIAIAFLPSHRNMRAYRE